MEMKGLISCVALLLFWVDCSMVKCAPTEDCQMKGDDLSCVKKPPAPKMGTCLAMGDPHYRTFDGRYFNFMGNCTYTLAKSCHMDKDQPAFEVEAQNTRRGKSPVTSISTVTVRVYGYIITILHGNVGLVRVNHEGWGLPIDLDKGKVVISQSGMSMLLKTDFGLTVQYDWEQYMVVTVPGSYADKVCGLCGNFNGKQDDDLATPTGSQATDVVALGKSWRVRGVAGDDGNSCQDECTGKCANCKGSFFENIKAKLFCSIISTLMNGPFHSCHAMMEPKMFHDMCMYDFCMGEGAKEYLCDSLQVYTDACQRAGIKVYDWRKVARCPEPKCPENSHYEHCGNACPASCENPKAPSKCKLSCVETCVCNPGYLLSGNQCVLPSQCGCMYDGHYAQPGKPFWGDDSCTKRCQCNPTSGMAECHTKRCTSGTQCTVVDGIRDCHPIPYAICQATSDSNFLTFDSQRYNFTGTCVYQLAGACSKKAGLEPFDVLVQSNIQDNKAGSVPQLVEVNVYGYSIVISKRYNKNTVKINEEIVNLPVNLPDKKVLVYKTGLYAVIETSFGLRVSFDWAGVVIVNVSIAYEGAMCGLCGNYNHEAQDDMRMMDGKEATSTKALGQSWRVAEIPGCVDGCRGTCPSCDFTQLKQYESLCHPLLDPKGPFQNCHPLVDPKGFYQVCLYDLCLDNSNGSLCHILTVYTDLCQDKGAKIEAWRNSSFCKDCSMVKCALNEDCQMKGDAPACIKKQPVPKMGTCLAMGDPHYRTFDGRYFNFMGNCTYTMAKSCHMNKDQPAFEVEAQNTRHGKSPVTSISKVTVRVYGYIITILHGNVGLVRVNYEGWGLPIDLDKGKVVISQSGMSMLLKTDFGLRVQYDWEQYMVVTVPGSYAGKVCGLCGNFNGKQDDDLATPTGSHATDVVALGKSWRVHSVAGEDGNSCLDECTGKCANCKGSFFENIKAKLFCSIISTLMNGPFHSCHAIVEPKMFHDMCMYDFCMGEGAKEYLCDSLQVYTDACQRAGIKVYNWRNLVHCSEPKCPENSHYEHCGNACPASCENPKAPSKCKLSCVESCVCNLGYLLSGNQCVLPSQCGCMYDGRYAQPGRLFWGDDSCTKRCQCNPIGGTAECHTTHCPSGTQCTVVDGIRDCHSIPYAICLATSDSNFLTFDSQRYNFTGTCVYQLAGACSKKAGLEPFDVLVQSKIQDNKAGSVPQLVEVNVYGYSIVISKRYNKNTVKINEKIVNLPVNLPDKKVLVYKTGLYAVIETSFGLRVSFDWAGVVIVNVSIAYEGAMCGLCGNYNHEAQDDMRMMDGKEATSTKALGQSWRVAEIPGCVDGCRGTCPSCDFTQLKQYESLCHPLLDPKGPFQNCHPLVDPKGFYQVCLYDLCLDNSNGSLCHILTVYTDLCQDKGAKIEAWRNSSFCKDCSMVKCALNEDCQMKGDAPACIKKQPVPKMGTCLAMGDPHYRTFDGRYFNFMGNCTYTMAKSCHMNKDQPAFEVEAQNTRHGKSPVTSISKVTVRVYGYIITILHGNVGLVRVNYEGWGLPIDLDKGKVVISQSGMSMLLKTDFGLRVQYDWEQYMVVTVPGSYAGKVCGLCGNFNGKQDDDLATPTGSQATDVVALGKSWRVHSVAGEDGNSCLDECTGKCANCKGSFFENIKAKLFCSIISTLMNGPFHSCHAIVEPKMFHDMCMYDFCMGEGAKEYLCDSLQVYTDACQRAGIKVYNWRNLVHCSEPKCPENSHYEHCGNACPASCENPKAPSKCKLSCVESCVCNLGYLLSGNQCVLPSQCGCMYDGRYAQPGRPFWGDDSCTKRCQCNPIGGTAECHTTHCPSGTQCTVVDGIRDCHPIPYTSTMDGKVDCKNNSCGPRKLCQKKNGAWGCQPVGYCSIYGDPHYQTFDNHNYTFQGTCTYTAAQFRHPEGTGLQPFSVVVENERWYGMADTGNVRDSKKVSVAKLVAVEVYGFTLILRRNQFGMIMVNGIMYNLPLNLDEGAVVASQNGMHYVIKTNFSLEVTYDLVYKVSVTVPEDYRGKTSGLCGNFNGKREDDFMLPDGTLAKSVQVFGAAWKVPVPGVICDDGCNGDFCHKCNEKKKATFEEDCALIKKVSGPFSACYGVLDPDSYYRDCVYDLCMSGGDRHPLCGSIEAYVSDCQNMGVSVQNWRSPNFCPLSCPANSHYRICDETCATPCPGLAKISSCHSSCAEGCSCDDGYYFNGTSCVERDRCGCFSEGQTYKRGESLISKGCQKNCTCAADGQLQCPPISCGSGEKCLVKDGLLGCYPAQCMLQARGVFTRFSGVSDIVMVAGVYELVSVCRQGTEAEWFRVVVDVRTCEESSLPTVVAVYVFFEDLFVLVNKNHETWVNGKKVSSLKMLKNKISVTVSDKVVVIEKQSGLHLTYNTKQEVSVSTAAHLTDKLCGACAKFTGDTNLFSIFGKPSIQSYMDNWRAQDFPSCGLSTASTNILS